MAAIAAGELAPLSAAREPDSWIVPPGDGRRRRELEEAEIRRLEAARAAMVRARQLVAQGRGLTAGVFDTGGVGDWEETPLHIRSLAFACRLCRSPESLEAFRRLVCHAEAHAGR